MKKTNFIFTIILSSTLTQFTFADTMAYNLVEGYNWISFNMEFEGQDLDDVLDIMGWPNGSQILSHYSGSSTFYEGFGWYGSLQNIEPGIMYQIYVDDDYFFVVEGSTLSEQYVEFQEGWNWFGPIGNILIEDFSSNLSSDFMIIDATSGTYSSHLGNGGGTLDRLSVNKGYYVKVDSNIYGNFPPDSFEHTAETQPPMYNYLFDSQYDTLNPSDYQYVSIIPAITDINENCIMIAAIDTDGNLRGISNSYVNPSNEEIDHELIIHLDNTININFLCLYASSASSEDFCIYESYNSMEVAPFEVLGDFNSPTQLDFNWNTCDNDEENGDCVTGNPNWDYYPPDYEFSAWMTASVTIDGIEQNSGILAAFHENEIRSIDSDGGSFFPPSSLHLYELSIFSNEPEGEIITFKFYDETNDVVINLNEYYTFEENDIVGDAFNPFQLTGTFECEDTPCDDLDADGMCDDIDDCIGQYDECGLCNGSGISNGECDCYGGILDNCGVCDSDPSNDCIIDCNGEFGGTAELDECGVCNGTAYNENDCDADGIDDDCEDEFNLGALSGDANLDGVLNVVDLVMFIDIILNGN